MTGKIKGSSIVHTVDAGDYGKFRHFFKIIQEVGEASEGDEVKLNLQSYSDFSVWEGMGFTIYTDRKAWKVEKL